MGNFSDGTEHSNGDARWRDKPKRVVLKLDTTFVDTKPAGLGLQYLKSGEIDLRAGIEIAIGCLFAPLGAAVRGASRKEVEALAAVSKTQLETYLHLALLRCDEDGAAKSQGEEDGALKVQFTPTVPNPPVAAVPVASVAAFEPEDNIDLDDNSFLELDPDKFEF